MRRPRSVDDFGSDKMREEAEKEGWLERPIERPKSISELPVEEQKRLLSPVVEGCISRNQIAKLHVLVRATFGEDDQATGTAKLNGFLKERFAIGSAEQIPIGKFGEVEKALMVFFRSKQKTRRTHPSEGSF